MNAMYKCTLFSQSSPSFLSFDTADRFANCLDYNVQSQFCPHALDHLISCNM